MIISQPATFFDKNQSAEVRAPQPHIVVVTSATPWVSTSPFVCVAQLANRLSHDVHEVAEHLVENATLGLQVDQRRDTLSALCWSRMEFGRA